MQLNIQNFLSSENTPNYLFKVKLLNITCGQVEHQTGWLLGSLVVGRETFNIFKHFEKTPDIFILQENVCYVDF